jgi:dipeptidyl-peptidase-4
MDNPMKHTLIFSFAFLASISLFSQTSELSLSDAMLNRKLYPETLPVPQWIPGTEKLSYCTADYQTMMVTDISGKRDTLVKLSTINGKMKERIKIPGLWMVQWIDANNLYFEITGKGFAYNLQTEELNILFAYENGAANQDAHLKSGQSAFTVENNLYITTKNGNAAVTNHKNKGIVAGQAIARSEYGITKGTFWSPNGTYLAFYEKDERQVADYPLLDITTTPGSLKSIKYPMAGQPSEISSVGIYNPSTKQTVYLKSTKAPDDYMTNLGWDPSEKFVYVAELNRATNHMKLNKYDAASGEFVATLFEEKNEKWVEPEHPVFFPEGSTDRFVWLSERDGFMNLFLYSTEGKLIKKLTSNPWETLEILASDAKGKYLFTVGTGINPTEKHLYKVDTKSGKQELLTSIPGTHNTSVSESGAYFLDQFSNVTTPGITTIYSTSESNKNKNLLVAANPLADYAVSLPQIITVKSADGTTDLYARMIKPADFDPTKKYPVLVYVYGGPHAQMVTNSWQAGAPLWMQYMAQRGYICFTLDNRGSGHRGFAFESVIHRNLGDAELEDQEAGVNYLKSLTYVDGERMAVHGWSYGGFMTTSLMLRKPGMFKVGVAGGPVTDWKWYEIMYGERYMDTPEENPEGYKKAEVAGYVKNLQGDLLLIHGTVDDVVVMQHNLALVKAFVDAGIQVDFFPYPMHPHNVRGKDRLHLMTKVLNYIETSLGTKTD